MSQQPQIEPIYTTRALIKDLARFLRPYRGRFVIATLARLIGDIAWLYPAYALATIITFVSSYRSGAPLTTLWTIFMLWLAASLTRYGTHYISRRIGFLAAERTAVDVQVQSMQKLFHLDLAWHEQENSGNKLKRIQRGGESIDRLARIWYNSMVEIVVNLIGMIIILATVDHLIAALTAIFAISYTLLSSVLLRRASAAAREVNASEENLNGMLFEGINNIRSAKVLNITDSLLNIVNQTGDSMLQKIRLRIARFQLRNVSLGMYTSVFSIVSFMYIAQQIIHGSLAVGFLVLFSYYFRRISDSMNELSDNVEGYITCKFAISRMMDILNTPVYEEGKGATKAFPKNWKMISLKHVSFAYGDQDVLRDVSFDIKRGERIGIVGLSGAGKSTLFKLLLKENENYSGEILVDDLPLKKIKKSSYYERATVVLQETEVFNFPLRENVTIANPSKADDPAALEKALEIAHVSSFLPRLPQGVETLIGEKGVKLSGGERQRVGIARAIFKEPDLLFLDEATSHLDLESEEQIRDSLHVFFQSVTAVVIAHRLTTIKEMDRILVLEDGKLIEQGTFDELYNLHGRFHQLWEKQKLS